MPSNSSLQSLHVRRQSQSRPSSTRRSLAAFFLDKRKKIPKCLKYYKIYCYIVLLSTILYCVVYLVYVLTILFNEHFHIQYELAVRFLEYNSYNLQCPILGILFASIFLYHVKYKVILKEGDFFGIIGIYLLFCMVMCYDATGVFHLYQNATHPHLEEAKAANPDEENELAWQYAWSTKPTCGRYHVIETQKRLHEDRELLKTSGESPGPGVQQHTNPLKDDINFWMYSGKTKTGVEKLALSASIKEADEVHIMNSDELAYKEVCNMTANDIRPVSKPRTWMIKMQREFKCCGPRGYEEWSTFVKDLSSCTDKKTKKMYTRSCLLPFNNYLAGVLVVSICLMLIMAFMFFLTIIAALLHFSAMKFEDEGIHKEYSLLDMSHPSDIREIEGHRSLTPGALYDPLRSLFQQTNIRTERSRRKTTEIHISPGLHKHLHPGGKLSSHTHAHGHTKQVKNVSQTLMALNKSRKQSMYHSSDHDHSH